MNNFVTVLKALFKNKLRIGEGKSKRSVIGFAAVLCTAYVLVMTGMLIMIVKFAELLALQPYTLLFYFFMLMTAALVVLIFGIINLVSVLYLSKDTDFFSMLPVKQSTVFAAKLSYVYISEMILVAVVLTPVSIAFGIVIKAWAWYYVSTLLMMAIIPAFPLVLAAIIAIPVMFIASKVKHREIITLIFYMALFGGFFGVYIYFMLMSSNTGVTPDALQTTLRALINIMYAFYPYTALALSAQGIPSYGLGVGASVSVNLIIFIGSSAVLLLILLTAARFMYAQSVKSNNQTNNSSAKKGEFKASSGLKSLIKREYISSLRTTQVAFQCYAVMLLPIIISVAFGLVFKKTLGSFGQIEYASGEKFFLLVSFCMLAAMFVTLGNAASTTFSREGQAVSSLKILPVGIKYILKAKIIAWACLAAPVATVCVAIVNIMIFDWQFMVLSVFSLIPLSVMFVIFGALWDLSAPKLKWTDPAQAIKHNGHVTIGQLLSMGVCLVILLVNYILFTNNVSIDVVSAVCWTLIYSVLVIFAIINIILYRKVELYYERIEI